MIVQTTSSEASGTRLIMRTSSVSPSSSAERVAGGPSAIRTACTSRLAVDDERLGAVQENASMPGARDNASLRHGSGSRTQR